MKLFASFEQNIALPGSIVGTDTFKDEFVDKLLDIRDNIVDRFDEFPVIYISPNTYNWLKKLFGNEITFLETIDKTIFWACDIERMDMRDGKFDFYISE